MNNAQKTTDQTDVWVDVSHNHAPWIADLRERLKANPATAHLADAPIKVEEPAE